MLTMQHNLHSKGFTMIEIMVVVAIIAIIFSTALPSFQSWIASTKVRAASESVLLGLQKARGEAIARNTNVSFTLTDAQSSWSINVVNPASVVEQRPASESSSNVNIVVQPAAATSITFNGFGGVVANAANLTRVDFSIAGTQRTFRVVISAGGSARMCDPQLAPNANARAC